VSVREQVRELERAADEFRRCVVGLDETTFLRKFGDWSPRDVVAHLIGWNVYTVEGGRQIMKREYPFYFSDPGEDFSKVNAVSVKKYGATDRRELLEQMHETVRGLRQFLLSLDPSEWDGNYGILYEDSPVTIKNTVDALISDYYEHRQLLLRWANEGGGPQGGIRHP